MKNAAILTLLVQLVATSAFAAGVVPGELASKTLKDQKDGTTKKLTLGFSGSANSSSNVVGAVEGTSMQLGLQMAGEYKKYWGKHGLETVGKLQHAQTRTPLLDSFVKSADVLELQTTWLFNLSEKPPAGPFARFKLATQVLGSVDVRGSKVTVVRNAVVAARPVRSGLHRALTGLGVAHVRGARGVLVGRALHDRGDVDATKPGLRLAVQGPVAAVAVFERSAVVIAGAHLRRDRVPDRRRRVWRTI